MIEFSHEAWACDHCGTGFLTDHLTTPLTCPVCWQATLAKVEDTSGMTDYHPEAVVPFGIDAERMAERVRDRLRGYWLRPPDLSAKKLIERAERVYLPVWWVDAKIDAVWQAEIGYPYVAVTHATDYKDGAWKTRELRVGRLRWEPRAGQLSRRYDNVAAPALDGDTLPERAPDPEAYHALALGDALLRLPDRTPEDAWNDAKLAFRANAAEEVREACAAEDVRDFLWKADYADHHWTMMLLPRYLSYYRGADGTRHTVEIDGVTGEVRLPNDPITGADIWRALKATRGLLLPLGIFLFLWYPALLDGRFPPMILVIPVLMILGLAVLRVLRVARE